MQNTNYTEETMALTFVEKSRDYPGGRIALLTDGRVVFPEIRFTPEVGKKYSCRVRFYERRNSVIGIAFPAEKTLSVTEYLHDEQIVVQITFVKERGSDLVARHPVSGAYIVPTDASENLITEGIQCWAMIVQRGTALYAHFIKNVEDEEKPPAPGTTVAQYDPSFAAQAEQSLLTKRGMGKPPVFMFKQKQRFPWEILDVDKETEMEEIRKAYRKLSKVLHPDLNPTANHEDFVALAHAHDWMTFRRQWADEVTKKTAEIPPVKVETITKKAKAKTAEKPPRKRGKTRLVNGEHSELPLTETNPKEAKKLADLKAEL